MNSDSDTGPSDPAALLADLRAATMRRADGLASNFDDIVDAQSDVATDDEHDPEGHTIAWERQQVAALLEDTRATLAGIDDAQQRLANGRYGVCSTCDGEIGTERLAALPTTPTCVNCSR